MEELSRKELEQLLTRGRIQRTEQEKHRKTGKMAPPKKKRPTKKPQSKNAERNETNQEPEVDPQWLKAQIEKTKTNVAQLPQDQEEEAQRRDASKF